MATTACWCYSITPLSFILCVSAKALSEAAIGTITGILALIVLILLPIDYVLSQRKQKTQKVWERRATKKKRKERVAAFTFHVASREGENTQRPPIVLMHPASPDLQPAATKPQGQDQGQGQRNGNLPHDALSVRSDRKDLSSIGSLLSDTAEYDSSYSYDNSSKSKKRKKKKKKNRREQDDDTMELQDHFQGEHVKVWFCNR